MGGGGRCSVGVRLKPVVCRREGKKISTMSNNNNYLQAERPQQVSLSFSVTCSYLRSECHGRFVPVTLQNNYKQRKWNIYLCMTETTGQFQGCRVEFTWNWARKWRPTSCSGKRVMCTFLWSEVIKVSALSLAIGAYKCSVAQTGHWRKH